MDTVLIPIRNIDSRHSLYIKLSKLGFEKGIFSKDGLLLCVSIFGLNEKREAAKKKLFS